MAKTVYDPRLGQLVYPVCTPQQVGRIVTIAASGKVLVQHKKELKWHDTTGLRDFDALLQDHAKKIRNLSKYAAALPEEKGDS